MRNWNILLNIVKIFVEYRSICGLCTITIFHNETMCKIVTFDNIIRRIMVLLLYLQQWYTLVCESNVLFIRNYVANQFVEFFVE